MLYEMFQFFIRVMSLPFAFIGTVCIIGSFIVNAIKINGIPRNDIKTRSICFVSGVTFITLTYGIWKI